MSRNWHKFHKVIPGQYVCHVCRAEKSHHQYYRDRTRHNGCCSRCKVCDDEYNKRRKDGRKQGLIHPHGKPQVTPETMRL